MSTSSVNSSSSSSSSSSTNPTGTNAFDSLNVQDFINMLVAELQNQDPTQPVDNSEILNEVSQIRSIESNDQLTTTLQSVLLGQNVATGGSLINQTITGTDAAGNSVGGWACGYGYAESCFAGNQLLHGWLANASPYWLFMYGTEYYSQGCP